MVSRELFGWSPPHIQPLTPVSRFRSRRSHRLCILIPVPRLRRRNRLRWRRRSRSQRRLSRRQLLFLSPAFSLAPIVLTGSLLPYDLLQLTAPLSSFTCISLPKSSRFLGKMPSFTRSRRFGSIKTAIQAGSALAFTSAFIDFRGQRIKHDSHKEYAAYNSALMKTIKGATTGLISGTIWVLLLPPGIMFLVLRETLLFQAS
ncbi:hypothetical protein Ahy_B04g072127 isoform B [Arachis hypogaea]|uniref:Uncharacterized protein n=1 Tax=Arachis hypogaea TaxID=3818 RepID=A0A444ZMH0_ARAHY|nr:hypothetical protein Ahy_B04g072127 isoform B [Arachis hypogaea]